MKVKEEKWIDNTEGAKLMVRCRTNSLQLCWRNKFTNGAVQCPGCGFETETLDHFLLECPIYLEIRNQFDFLQQLQERSVEEKISNILVFDEVTESETKVRKSYLVKLWLKRQTYQRANTN